MATAIRLKCLTIIKSVRRKLLKMCITLYDKHKNYYDQWPEGKQQPFQYFLCVSVKFFFYISQSSRKYLMKTEKKNPN